MARTAEKPILNDFVQVLMDLLKCKGSYKEAERKTGISEATWRSWANGKGSPLAFLEWSNSLEEKTGKDLKELVKLGRKTDRIYNDGTAD